MWPLRANFISFGPVTRTRAASSLIRNEVDIQGLARPSDFLGLASVMPMGLADVNIKHLRSFPFASAGFLDVRARTPPWPRRVTRSQSLDTDRASISLGIAWLPSFGINLRLILPAHLKEAGHGLGRP